MNKKCVNFKIGEGLHIKLEKLISFWRIKYSDLTSMMLSNLPEKKILFKNFCDKKNYKYDEPSITQKSIFMFEDEINKLNDLCFSYLLPNKSVFFKLLVLFYYDFYIEKHVESREEFNE